jgi:hypothetical protein
MATVFYRGTQYKLRAGAPMPIAGSLGSFVLHTFMAEQSDVDSYLCIEQLPASSEFRGQGGDLIQASFSRLQDIGGNTFSGRMVYSPTYIDEDALGFNF